MTRDFDAIIIGSGPAGSTAAEVLTAAGLSVLILERGRNHLIDLDNPAALPQRFSSDELKYMTRHFLGPDPWAEPRTFRTSIIDGDRQVVGEVNNLPATVGGGGVHADGKLPRFREDDFLVESELGPVEGASIADWPVTYDEMEPYYAEAERLVGVAGLAGANPFAAWRSGEYPMPPGPAMYGALVTSAAARELGYHPYPAPTGVNSVEYDGRPACNNCGFCAYFGCPIHAKGDPVAPLRRALVTGRAQLRPQSHASSILIRNGKATGVEWIDARGERHIERAERIVVACGAMETPRLLLLSGLTNAQIGRNVMFHMQTFVFGIMPFRVHGHIGRSVTHVHDDHIVVDAAARAAAAEAGLPWIKGGLVEHCSPSHVIAEAKQYPWGPQHKIMMRESPMRDRLLGFCMQGDDLPQVTNTVDLDPAVTDIWGLPVARTTYQLHTHELIASRHHGAKLVKIMKAAGAERIMTATSPKTTGDLATSHSEISQVPISRHVAGTARFGTDPSSSACDPWGRLWEAPNIMIADSSVFPTGSGYGPTLTLVALSLRNSRAFAT
jgi:gluconate 2-dehydrogenase alpha chain